VPVPLRQDIAAEADTGRGLLLTVLGELVLPAGGAAWTQTLLEVLDALGVRDKAARQTLARMHARGWLARERIGRQTRWTLTESARTVLEQGADRIYSFGQGERPWDGRWLLLLASVPERDRQARYRMNVGLTWAGFGTIGPGIWVSPWVDREAAAADLLRGLGVDGSSFRAELGELGDPARLTDAAWDLPALRAQYEEFLTDTDALGGRAHGVVPRGVTAASELALLVHRWRRFPFIDPDLPAAVLPTDWPAPAAARRFAELRERLGEPSRDWWQATEAALESSVSR
jgi:phenylacetic acid degradation operon negative regulatory protein